jgi:hypothetical protein
MAARDLPNGLRSAGMRVAVLVLAGAVLLASVFAGRTYSWCRLTQQVCSDACATDGCDDSHEGEAGPVAHEPCCEDRALGELPPSAQRDGVPAVPAAPVALLPPRPPSLVFGTARPPAAPSPTSRPNARRAPLGARSSPAARRCAFLQVFRC